MQRGRPLQEVKDFLGHKTLAVTLHDAHFAAKNLRKAASALDGILPSGLSTHPAHELATNVVQSKNIEVTA